MFGCLGALDGWATRCPFLRAGKSRNSEAAAHVMASKRSKGVILDRLVPGSAGTGRMPTAHWARPSSDAHRVGRWGAGRGRPRDGYDTMNLLDQPGLGDGGEARWELSGRDRVYHVGHGVRAYRLRFPGQRAFELQHGGSCPVCGDECGGRRPAVGNVEPGPVATDTVADCGNTVNDSGPPCAPAASSAPSRTTTGREPTESTKVPPQAALPLRQRSPQTPQRKSLEASIPEDNDAGWPPACGILAQTRRSATVLQAVIIWATPW